MALWRPPWRARAELDAEIRDELESHLALAIDDLTAEGQGPEAAEETARRRFGDRRRVEKELVTMGRRRLRRARRLELLADLIQDVRLAFRQLRRQRGFALAVIAVIALGVGATTAVFAVIDAGLFRPLPFAHGDRLVYLWDTQGEDGDQIAPSLPEYRDWVRESGDWIDASVAITANGVRLRTDRGWDVLVAGRVEGDMRRVTGKDPVLGRWFTVDEEKAKAQVCLIDEGTWRGRFAGRPDIVGQTIELATGSFTIIGVAGADTSLLRAAGEGGTVHLWVPLVEEVWMERGLHFLRVIGRLKDGVSLDGGRAAAAVLEQRLIGTGVTKHGLRVASAREILVGEARPIYVALASAALFVLLTVCANLGNLFLWKSLARGREFAVRAALGASRARLCRQVLTESLVIGLVGGAAGLGASHLLVGVTRAVADRAGALAPAHADLRVALFAMALSVVVGLVFGLWPALRAARADLAGSLKESSTQLTAGAGAGWRRKILVGAEVAFSVMLLCGAGLLVRSLVRMLGEDPGFDGRGVIAFREILGDKRYEDDTQVVLHMDELRRRLLALPGVTAAGVSSQLPLERSDTNGSFEVAGRTYTDETRPGAKKRIVGPGYFEALRIPVVRGRAFTDADRPGAPDVVIISEAIARRHFPGEDPIGKRIKFSWGPGDEQEIVGVVGDVRHDGLDRPVSGILYRPAAQFARTSLAWAVRAGGGAGLAGLAAQIRREVQSIDETVPAFDFRSMDEIQKIWLAPRRDMVLVLGGFAFIAALLAAVGAYAVTAQMVSLRTREIGLRVACGAGPADILRMVLGEGAIMIGAGVAVGLLGALVATRVLSSFLYGVSARDPTTLVAAPAVLVLAALLAVYLPARRAAKMDPMIALRL